MRGVKINVQCQVPGCERTAIHATGPVPCCNMHFRRWWRYGQFSPKKKGRGHIRKSRNTDYRIITFGGKQIFEHRAIMEEHLGRKLRRDEHIHHINRNGMDNRIENLMVLTASEHVKLHRTEASACL